MSGSSREFDFQFAHERLTWAVHTLILINVLALAAQLVLDVPFGGRGILGGQVAGWLAFSPSGFVHGAVWTAFTYMFLHSGLMHLFFNMLSLYFFGPDVERALGTHQFYRYFVLCGAGGVLLNILQLFSDPHTPIIGASGATLGVLVAFAMIAPERQIFLFPIPVPINARALVLIIVVMNFVAALGGDSGTSWLTHFGGMGVGYLYMKYRPKFTAWQDSRRKAAGPSKKDMDKLGEEINNILKFHNKEH